MSLVHNLYIRTNRNRPDHKWNWPAVISAVTFGNGFRREPRIYQFCLAEDEFPLAMIALLQEERLISDHKQTALYLYYLSAAPGAAVQGHGAPRGLGKAALDVARVISLNTKAAGRMWLHADPLGCGELLDWYEAQGMKRVPLGASLPGSLLVDRINDGRYFEYSATGNILACSGMQEYRD